MNSIPIDNVRNFAVMGHTASGKTALVDALLFRLGVNDRLGSTDAGSSMADYTDEEKTRKITTVAKPFSGVYKAAGKDMSLTFIDTPGYMDFFGQVVSAVRATDTALIAINAGPGIQVGTHQAWRKAEQQGLARAIVITGLDRENTDFAERLSEIQAAFGSNCVPVVVPTPDCSGVIDVLAAKNVPDEMAAQVEEIKGSIVELAAETDDSLIEKYLGGEALTPEEIAAGLREAVARSGFVPVFACMALKDVGVAELLDGVCRLLPCPSDHTVEDKDGNAIAAAADAPFVGLIWRTVNDPFVGQLAFLRVRGGTIRGDSEVFNSSTGQKERIGSLILVNGKKQETVSQAAVGDIVAIPKLKATGIGDTLCAMGETIVCKPVVFPKPVMFQAVEAKTQADEDKIGIALARLVEEDPTLHVDRNAETHQTILSGLGDVHIDVAVERMKSRSNVEVTLGTPKVPYRETVTGMGEGHYKHKKQSGGRGQYGEVYLRVEAKQPDDEEWFVNAIVGGVIPGNFIPAVQKGLVEGMQTGALAGYPVGNVKVSLYDGSYHDVDSSEIAFKIAGARALKEGMANAKPVLLEPIMTIKVIAPDQYLGDINGDLNHKRGHIMGMGPEDNMQAITAEVPQSELFRYAAELRSMTAGQGTFEMEFARYEQMPANITQKVIAESQKEDEEA